MLRTLYKNAFKLNFAKTQTRTVNETIKQDVKSKNIQKVNLRNVNIKKVNVGNLNTEKVNKTITKNQNKKILIQPEPKKYNDIPLL